MQTFKDTVTGKYYQFEDDVIFKNNRFYAPHDLINPLNIPTTLEVSDPPSTPSLTLDELKVVQVARISADCSAAILSGFTSSALGSAHHYPTTLLDQQNMTVSVLSSLMPNLPSNWTTPFWCEDSSGVWAMVPHTAAQIQQAGEDGKATVLAYMKQNDTLAAEVMSSATTEPAQVAAIVWTLPA